MQQMPNQMENQQQTSNIVLVKVPSIDVVYNYPVPAGSAMSFMHESKPIMFIKTVPSSPVESARVDVYQIVKMDGEYKENKEIEPTNAYVTEERFDALEDRINGLEEKLNESIYRKPKRNWNTTKPEHKPEHKPELK